MLAFSQAIFSYDFSFAVKFSLSNGMFPSTLVSNGTERLGKFVSKSANNKIVGAFALTEISHGTNANGNYMVIYIIEIIILICFPF